MMRFFILLVYSFLHLSAFSQYNTERLLMIGRSALYYEDYVLSIQYFNQAISAKPYLYEPWFFRGLAKYYLEDFLGAETDCTKAIERNPYVVNNYELRAIARIKRNDFRGAADDYSRAITYAPDNQNLWHNRVLCHIQSKNYRQAITELDTISHRWSNYAPAYSMRAEVLLLQKDTVQALEALNKSIEIDEYDGAVWATKSNIYLSKEQWKSAEEALNKAIHLKPKQSGYYINRALARLKQNNLRGAMADYDTALDIDPNNYLGHYNRGLLRAQVGDDNRAIEDFDFVLTVEPNNYMALFNRALLLETTGDLKKAIDDYTTIIGQYPNFWAGLEHRAACYRKLGMAKKAEQDEFRVYKAQLYKHLYGIQPRLNKEQLRKRSDDDLDKYNQIVVADEQEEVHEYKNDYRGKVQNRKVDMTFKPMYAMSFQSAQSEVKRYVPYAPEIEEINHQSPYGKKIYVSCDVPALTEKESKEYFDYIALLSEQAGKMESSKLTGVLFQRAIAYTVTQNFDEAKDDLSACIQSDSSMVVAYWQRALCYAKQANFLKSQGKEHQLMLTMAVNDLTAAIHLNQQNPYLYYNRANVYVMLNDIARAVDDYSRAIVLDKNMAEAYYNRGIARIRLSHKAQGIQDLSKAGELGLYEAYSILKQTAK